MMDVSGRTSRIQAKSRKNREPGARFRAMAG
jgi:ribosomal protein S30